MKSIDTITSWKVRFDVRPFSTSESACVACESESSRANLNRAETEDGKNIWKKKFRSTSSACAWTETKYVYTVARVAAPCNL